MYCFNIIFSLNSKILPEYFLTYFSSILINQNTPLDIEIQALVFLRRTIRSLTI